MNLKVRLKNPYFWLGLIAVILTAMNVDASTITSWQILYQHLIELVSNPFMIGSVIVAVLGVFIDPTTKGIKDSQRAMQYKSPGDLGEK